jgi:hypothetical protein
MAMIPDGSSARIQLFDSTGKMIRAWSFRTSWRITLEAASMQPSGELGTDAIILKMERCHQRIARC